MKMNLNKDKTEVISFNQLYREYHRRFVSFANSYLKDMMASEDIVSEAIIYYLERKDSLHSESNIPAYILTVIKHKCLNHLRHQQVKEEYSESVKSYYEWELNIRITTLKACEPNALFVSEIEQLVEESLASMPENTRKIFILNRYENKTYKEISDLTGISPKGVEFHISKALKILRIHLKDYFPLFFLFFLTRH